MLLYLGYPVAFCFGQARHYVLAMRSEGQQTARSAVESWRLVSQRCLGQAFGARVAMPSIMSAPVETRINKYHRNQLYQVNIWPIM